MNKEIGRGITPGKVIIAETDDRTQAELEVRLEIVGEGEIFIPITDYRNGLTPQR